MADRLKILTCSHYLDETNRAVSLLHLEDVDVVLMPSQCAHCLRHDPARLKAHIAANFQVDDDVRLVVPLQTEPGTGQMCQTMLCGSSLIAHYTASGHYILSPGWLKEWKNIVMMEWGFEGDAGRAFFGESASKLLLLDTELDSGASLHLQQLMDFSGLPGEILPVGMDHYSSLVKLVYENWQLDRLKFTAEAAQRKVSDYAMVFELIPQIASLAPAEQLVQNTFDLLEMFTAAANMAFQPAETVDEADPDDTGNLMFHRKSAFPSSLADIDKSGIPDAGRRTASGTGFLLQVAMDTHIYGYLEVEGVLFPAHLDSYLQLSRFIVKILALALSNARNYRHAILARQSAESANLLKGRFLANMSHEIRTPMNGIMGYLQLLQKSTLSMEQTEYVQEARSASDILLYLINDILDFSKIEAGKLSLEKIPFRLRSAIEDTISIHAQKASEKGLDFHLLIHAGVPEEVIGDPTRLRQILNNLVGNALKFTERGEVSLLAECTEILEETATIRFVVRDSGIGISEEAQKSLFTSFAQADTSITRKFGGTGLGLAISRELVQMMDGDMEAKRNPDAGSTFVFTARFRLSEPSPSHSNPYIRLQGVNVLIADANGKSREILRHYLETAGCLVSEADNGHEALSVVLSAAGTSEEIALAILDRELPDKSAGDLAATLRMIPGDEDIKLILMYACGFHGDAAEAKKMGFSGYLGKPIKRDNLLHCAAIVLESDVQAEDAILVTQHVVKERLDERKPRILLAEDNEINRKIFTTMLASHGWACDLAFNGNEAWQAVLKRNYDIIFMDCEMPVMDGFTCTKNIRLKEGAGRRTPIVALTARAMQGDREVCLAAGMDDYISKPVDFGLVIELVNAHFGTRPDGSAFSAFIHPFAKEFIANMQFSAELAEELYEDFAVSTVQLAEGMSDAQDRGDYPALKSLSHQVKGTAGNLHIQPVHALMGELEQAAGGGQAEKCKQLLDDFLRMFQES